MRRAFTTDLGRACRIKQILGAETHLRMAEVIMRFLLGLSIGIAVGLLFAPQSGIETRRELKEKAGALQRRAVETGRDKAGELGREAGERAFDRVVGEERRGA